MASLLSVFMRSAEEVLYLGEAESVSSVNEKGSFDILPLHSNFISIIKNKVVITLNNRPQEFKIDSAIMKVKRNNVQIYSGTEILETFSNNQKSSPVSSNL